MKRIVVFDFDGTLTKKDSFIDFILFSKGYVHFFLGLFLMSPFLLAWKINIYPNWKVKQKLFSFYFKGTHLNLFEKWCVNYTERINTIIKPNAIELFEDYKKKGYIVVIVTASIENWIYPWAKKKGFHEVIGTKIDVDKNYNITGKFSTKNCYGLEKVRRLNAYIVNREEFYIMAYGDSKGDKELLQFANEAYYRET